ncbi:MAG: hypothetical protein PHY80_05330 [Rickettsiales bacterium]|nr:hypothetical protein [Rickettsiales bacterium]
MNKIKIVFLYRGLNFWLNNHSFYKECLWDGGFDIWVVPESNSIDSEILQIFKNDKIHIMEKNIKDGKYFDLKRLNPDYVLIATPYKEQRNKIYNSSYLSKFTKVIYIPYGPEVYATHSSNHFNQNNTDFFWLYRIFLHTDQEIEDYAKGILKTKIVKAGHPIFDLFLIKQFRDFFTTNSDKLWNFEDHNHIRILWTPHWTIKPWGYLDNANVSVGNSDFINYSELFLKLPKMFPNIDLVMRPHPNLFVQLENQTDNVWNEAKIENWKKEFTSNINAKIDNNSNYVSQFLSSDIIINSSAAFSIITLLSDKKIISTRNKNSVKFLNNVMDIEKSYYSPSNEEELVQNIKECFEKDIFFNKRKEKIKEKIDNPSDGSGKFIKDYLKKDFLSVNNLKLHTNSVKNIYKQLYKIK